MDLKLKALEACRSLEFVTSDNPVVLYNPYSLGAEKLQASATGIQSRGLQVFLPISNKITLVYYDSAVYKIGDKRQDLVRIGERDVQSLNFLQMLNATENVYFHSDPIAAHVEKLVTSAIRARRDTKSVARTIYHSPTRHVVRFHRTDITNKVAMGFCKLLEMPPKVWEPSIVGARKPEFYQLFERVIRELHSGRREISDYQDFLAACLGTRWRERATKRRGEQGDCTRN